MLEEREIRSYNKICHLSAINMKLQSIEVSQKKKKSQAHNTKMLKPQGTYLYLSHKITKL